MMRVASGWVAASQYALPPFRLHRPQHIAEAASLIAAGGVPMAGGTDLVAQLREGLAIADLVDLAAVPGLAGITREGETLRIGAATTHAEAAANPLLHSLLPGLAQAWGYIATPRVRVLGTIGGNVMAGRTRYEGRLLFGTAGAWLRFADGGSMPVADLRSAAPPRCLLTDIVIPRAHRLRFHYRRELRPMVTLALCLQPEEGGGFSGRAGIATERLPPLFLPLPPLRDPAGEARAAAAEAFAALPEDFADAMSGHAWLRAAGQALLVRALEAIGR